MLEHAEVKRYLPHRHPALQVDRVLELEPGRRIVATKAVTGAEPCYADLAEDLPATAYAYPATLLLESLGQSGAVLWRYTAALDGGIGAGTLVFGSARDFVVTAPAYPGDVLRHEVVVETAKREYAVLSGQTWVGARQVATLGSMLAVLRADPSPDPPPDPHPEQSRRREQAASVLTTTGSQEVSR